MRVYVRKQKLSLYVVCVHRRPWSSPFKTGRGGGVCAQPTLNMAMFQVSFDP